MKFTSTAIIAAALALSTSSTTAFPFKRAIDASLVPQFGLASGLNPTGTGDCDGINGPNGQAIKIPCFCPPDRNEFIRITDQNVAAGFVVNNPSVKVSFPTDNSRDSQLARMQTALVTLQNLRGPGVGCPAASTTFVAQQKAIADGAAPPPPAAPAPPPPAQAPPAPAPPPAGGVDPALVPEFGITAGTNPTGTGDCDGANGPNGQAIKVPCSCPPDRNEFIQLLSQNVAAGSVINNPSVGISFPTDNSKESRRTRLQAATVTLQNLRGPGVGCPNAATTFGAQLDAINAE